MSRLPGAVPGNQASEEPMSTETQPEQTIEQTPTTEQTPSPVVEKAEKPKLKAVKANVEKGAKSKGAKAKAKGKPKAEKPKAKPVKKAKKNEAPKRKPGPWLKHFKPGVDMSKVGVCRVKGCKVKLENRAKWCPKHKKEIRKLQLKLNNQTWFKRIDEGTAGHHIVYTVNGKTRATEWARVNPARAMKLAQEQGTVEPDKLKKLIDQAQKEYEVKLRTAERLRKEAAKRRQAMKTKKAKEAKEAKPAKAKKAKGEAKAA